MTRTRENDETEDNDIVCERKQQCGLGADGGKGKAQAASGTLRLYYGEFDPGSG